MAKKSKGMGLGEELAIGAGVLAAAGAAGYYFYGSDGAKKHRAAAAKWTKNLKNDVVKRAKKLPKIDAKTLAVIVDEAASAYQNARGVSREDLAGAAKELKKHWNRVAAELQKPRSAAKAVKKGRAAVGKAVKAVKKAAGRGGKKARR